MNKKDLISKCRYYNGETNNPYSNPESGDSFFWYNELCWVDFIFNNPDSLNFEIAQYRQAGLSNFNTDDGTPISLKALLFNRFQHWCYCNTPIEAAKMFMKYYLQHYLK